MSKTRTSYDYDIIICEACDGTGRQTREELVDYHRREYRTEKYRCAMCGGSGRLERKVTTETWPFVPEEEVV